ncbi:membrane protein [Bacteroidia bacterium]|nr:membrane protein [Bacteroidia bacterium]
MTLAVGCLSCASLSAQKSLTEIRYSVMDLYALRYYPFQPEADSIIQQMGEWQEIKQEALHQKTSLNLAINKEFLDNQIQYSVTANDLVYKQLIKPYQAWLQYAEPLKEDSREIALTIGLQDDSKNEAIYEFLGKQNVNYLLDEMLGDVDVFKNKDSYHYFLTGKKILDNQAVYEIAFYPKKAQADAFTGYLYVTADGNYSLLKTLFTRSNPYSTGLVRDILFTQTFEMKGKQIFPLKKEASFAWGDEIKGSLLVNQTLHYTDTIDPLTASEKQVEKVVEIASQTRAFRNLKNTAHFLLTNRLLIGGDQGLLEWGPVTQSISYNEMEGLRLKAGGNTTLQLNKRLLLGGYLAYGLRDEQFKYRGDLLYSFLPKDKDIWEFPKRLLSLSYIRDLNVPGKDLQNSTRDEFFHSFSHSGTYNMSQQKLASIRYEHELPNRLSFRIDGKYLHDQPMGNIQYEPYTISELNFSLRYAPGEIFLQNRDDRIYLRRGKIELNLNHRMGLKGALGSDYRYHITDFSANKRFSLSPKVGTADVQLSAGKIWNRVPFPLLFIPAGNQSYIYEENDYNLMDFYEFTTDRFVAGNVNFRFNWSPFNWFSQSQIKTTCGIKALYGSLAETNDPYVEVHIGLANIFKLLRVEWVQRLTYGEKGSIFISSGFAL